jgi:hypothetical protein
MLLAHSVKIIYIINILIKKACLTQLAEYRSCKPKVIGSNPIAGLNFLKKNIC